nr:sce7726 family protein [uncultured Pedobacter sp.]
MNALSKLISNAGFQRLAGRDDFREYGKQMKKLLKKTGVELKEKCKLKDIINASYSHLSNHYRHEYLYKSALLNSYVLNNYSLEDTILLNEFKIGNSKADAVLVNGTNKVFEIKTELDSPERLATQLADYYKVFNKVYLVIHHTLINKYASLVTEKVGLMVFNDNVITTYREAIADDTAIDRTAMMKALRKDEYLRLVLRLNGDIPQVQPVSLFKTCLNILSLYAIDEVHNEFLRIIKERISKTANQHVLNSDLPEIIKFSCYNSNFTQNDYIGLIKKLNYQF